MSKNTTPTTTADFIALGEMEVRLFYKHAALREDGTRSMGGHCARAHAAQQQHAKFQGYMHDATLYNRFETMNPALVGKLMHFGTAYNLEGMGYTGARSNTGTSLTPIFTVALRKLAEEFGKDAVVTDFEAGFRGIRNTMQVKLRFIQIMDDIVSGLIDRFVAA